MSDKFYPPLSEEGKQEAELVVKWAKEELKKVCEEALSKIYVDIPVYIESDSWTNFRNDVMDGYQDYSRRKIIRDYDFKRIREKIFCEFRDEIIKDLDQDNLDKIKELQKEIAHLREIMRSR